MRTDLAVQGILTASFSQLLWWAAVAIMAFKVFALVDAAARREDAYRATGKQTKPFWLIILGIAVVLDFVFGIGGFGILALAGLVAAIVYMVDVRPAIRAITPPRRNKWLNRKNQGQNQGQDRPWRS